MRCLNKCSLTALFAAVASLALGTCGGSSGPPSEGGVYDPRDARFDGPTLDSGAVGCDLATQNCTPGERCEVACEGTTAVAACRPDNGGAAPGTACSATPITCGKGTGCMGTPLACRRYCTGDGDCAAGERCQSVSAAYDCGGSLLSTLSLHYCFAGL